MAQYWVTGTQYNPLSAVPGYTFTRSGIQGAVDSGGTVAFFAANTPAINSNGYHAYGALTNVVLQSQAFNTTWVPVSGSVAADTLAAPDGTTTADTFTNSTATAAHYVYNSYTNGATGAYTFSVCAKAGTGRYLQVTDDHGPASNWVNFDLVSGTVGTTSGAGVTGYIIPLSNGWYRCVVTASAASVAASPVYLAIVPASNSGQLASYLGASETVYLWQAQTILGTFPDGGPLIATTTAAASIGASVLTNTDTVGAAADQMFWATSAVPAVASDSRLAVWDDAGTSNKVDLAFQSATAAYGIITAATANVYISTTVAVVAGQTTTLVMRRLSGNWRVGKVVSGVLAWADAGAAAAFPTGMTRLDTGQYITGASQLNSPAKGAFRKLGTFDTDAKVLAAVAETA